MDVSQQVINEICDFPGAGRTTADGRYTLISDNIIGEARHSHWVLLVFRDNKTGQVYFINANRHEDPAQFPHRYPHVKHLHVVR